MEGIYLAEYDFKGKYFLNPWTVCWPVPEEQGLDLEGRLKAGSVVYGASDSFSGIYPSESHLKPHSDKDKIPLEVLPFGGDVQPGANLRETSRRMRSRQGTKGSNSGNLLITEQPWGLA